MLILTLEHGDVVKLNDLSLSKGAKSAGQKILSGELRDFAARIAKYMVAQNYWIDERYNNIVYVEGCDSDACPNADIMNEWNDLRLILRVENGIPKISNYWKATTEPGLKYTNNPLNPGGAFRIAFAGIKPMKLWYRWVRLKATAIATKMASAQVTQL
jgi:hypothetical protein